MFTTDTLSDWGLNPVSLTDRPAMEPFFQALREPLSDYTYSQIFTWRNSLRLAWRILHDHLCVFANGSGDLTLLLPPLGGADVGPAWEAAVEIMNDYNRAHDCLERTRVEYVSEELLGRFEPCGANVIPQGNDYVYDVGRMIDLAGGDLASKRQAKNRFLRNYAHRVESYDPALHLAECLGLLDSWKDRQDHAHAADESSAGIKRTKESLATRLTLEHAAELGLRGIIVRVEAPDGTWPIRGFTFGEALGTEQASIVIEKTDLECKGLAQFIFSEFCRICWADRPLINAGDDWGLESLAWTKSSYRPVKLLRKFVLTPKARVAVAIPERHEGTEARRHEGEEKAKDEGRGMKDEPTGEKTPVSERSDDPGFAQDSGLSTQGLSPTTHYPLPTTNSPSQDSGLRTQHSDLTIRLATHADLDCVERLEHACFSLYTLNRRSLRHLLSSGTAGFLVAQLGERIVGEGIALVRRHRGGGISGRIYSLAVDGACRGKGIGEKLTRALIAHLQSHGVQRVFLEVEASNASAVRLYERLGFRAVGKLADYYGPGQDGLHMLCEIALPVAA